MSEEVITRSSKQQNKLIAKLFFIVSLMVLAFGVIFVFIDKNLFFKIFFASLILFGITAGLLFCPPRSIVFKLPRRIIFDIQNDTISLTIEQLNSKPNIKKITNIKTIYDCGEYYFFTFKKDMSDSLVCQKNLLVAGTLSEFEKYFESKITKQSNY